MQLGLLKFWVATNELRSKDRKAALASAAHLFYTYMNGKDQIIKLDKVSIDSKLFFALLLDDNL